MPAALFDVYWNLFQRNVGKVSDNLEKQDWLIIFIRVIPLGNVKYTKNHHCNCYNTYSRGVTKLIMLGLKPWPPEL